MEITLSEIAETTDKEYITFVVDMSVSSSETVSSSSAEEESSCSAEEESSSSVEEISSSSETESSSSAVASSSSTPRSSSSMSSSSAAPAAIAFNNGLLQVQAHGPKTIRIFSPHGKLLYETIVYEKENLFTAPRQFKSSKNIITVSQNGKVLFTGVLATIPR